MDHSMKDGAGIYDELRASRKTDAFEEWSEYRKAVTQVVMANCQEGGHLAIMGAGHCNDVDLGKLAEHFSKITLIDFDEAAMMRARKLQGMEHDRRLHLRVVDFVGLKAADYIHYADVVSRALENRFTMESSKGVFPILAELNSMYAKISQYKVELGQDVYDCSLVLGVHSQLNDMADWIWDQCRTQAIRRVDEIQDAVRSRINAETEAIVHRFNDGVCRATRQTLITGHEIGIRGEHRWVQGAAQAECDLKIREINEELELRQARFLEWPYDAASHMTFTMLIQIFHMRKF